MPAVIPLIISIISQIATNAPKALAAYQAVKDFISQLFGAGMITKEQQDALHKHVDQTAVAFLNGTPPPQWTVEPDPVP